GLGAAGAQAFLGGGQVALGPVPVAAAGADRPQLLLDQPALGPGGRPGGGGVGGQGGVVVADQGLQVADAGVQAGGVGGAEGGRGPVMVQGLVVGEYGPGLVAGPPVPVGGRGRDPAGPQVAGER